MTNNYEITIARPSDARAIAEMQFQSWLDTYINEEYGVTEGYIRDRWAEKLTDAGVKRRADLIASTNSEGGLYLVAKLDGQVVGMAMATRGSDYTPGDKEAGKYRLSAIYTAKETHGTGLAQAIMQKVLDWVDPSAPLYVNVAAYNSRAKHFYEKSGFVEIPGSLHQFENDKIPEIEMVRKGEEI